MTGKNGPPGNGEIAGSSSSLESITNEIFGKIDEHISDSSNASEILTALGRLKEIIGSVQGVEDGAMIQIQGMLAAAIFSIEHDVAQGRAVLATRVKQSLKKAIEKILG